MARSASVQQRETSYNNSHVLKLLLLLLLLLLHYDLLIINYFSMLKYYHKSHVLTISAQSFV
jgi:hypothetical protein